MIFSPLFSDAGFSDATIAFSPPLVSLFADAADCFRCPPPPFSAAAFDFALPAIAFLRDYAMIAAMTRHTLYFRHSFAASPYFLISLRRFAPDI